MRCPNCSKRTMLPQGDPKVRLNVPYLCAICGYSFTPLRMTPEMFEVWNRTTTAMVKNAESAADLEFERMARNLRDKGHPEPETLND